MGSAVGLTGDDRVTWVPRSRGEVPDDQSDLYGPYWVLVCEPWTWDYLRPTNPSTRDPADLSKSRRGWGRGCISRRVE